MAGGVTVIDRGWKRLQRKFLGRGITHAVRVGVQGPEATKEDHDGITNVKIAGVHEFGSPKKNIPERSFFRSTFDKNRKSYERELKKIGQDMVAGKTTSAAGLRMLGEDYRSDIIDRVRGMEIKQDLSARTQARRAGESGPALWDTGQMMGSIDVELEK